jgi:hypothetical protein
LKPQKCVKRGLSVRKALENTMCAVEAHLQNQIFSEMRSALALLNAERKACR